MLSLIHISYVLDGTTLSFTKNGTEWTYDGDQSVDIDESALETLLNKASGNRLSAGVRQLSGAGRGDERADALPHRQLLCGICPVSYTHQMCIRDRYCAQYTIFSNAMQYFCNI